MNKRSRLYVRLCAGLLAADGLFFCLTDPNKAPSQTFIIAFLLSSVTFYAVVRAIVATVGWYGLRVPHKLRLINTVAAGAAVILGLQSAGQLTVRDVVLLMPLLMIGYFYLVYGERQSAV